MKKIKLSNGKHTIVDDRVYEVLNDFKWHYSEGYAVMAFTLNRKPRRLLMHRFITNAPNNMQVDHINFDRLDNRRSNLRLCTVAENNFHQRMSKKNTSGYRGVFKRSQTKNWKAEIGVNGKSIHLGYYSDIADAANAYKLAAKKYYKEFAK